MAHTKMKLTIELVPATSWFKSLYNLLPKDEWSKLKEKVYAEEGRKCYVCGSTSGPFELHEFWQYHDKAHVQKLVGVHHLCRLCHRIKHVGFYCHTADGREKLKQEGLSRQDLIKHFCTVNKCVEKDFLRHERQAFKVWRRRSKHVWKLDLGEYNKYMERFALEQPLSLRHEVAHMPSEKISREAFTQSWKRTAAKLGLS